MRHLGGSRSSAEKDIGGGHHGTVAPQESKIRPDHAAESPQQIGSMISPPPLVAFSLPVVSASDELVLGFGVDGKQEGGERGKGWMGCVSTEGLQNWSGQTSPVRFRFGSVPNRPKFKIQI